MHDGETFDEHVRRMRELKRRGPPPGTHGVADELLADDEKRERDEKSAPVDNKT